MHTRKKKPNPADTLRRWLQFLQKNWVVLFPVTVYLIAWINLLDFQDMHHTHCVLPKNVICDYFGIPVPVKIFLVTLVPVAFWLIAAMAVTHFRKQTKKTLILGGALILILLHRQIVQGLQFGNTYSIIAQQLDYCSSLLRIAPYTECLLNFMPRK